MPFLEAGPEWGTYEAPGFPLQPGFEPDRAAPRVDAEQPPVAPRHPGLCLAHSQTQPLQRPGSGARGSCGNWLGGWNQNRASNGYSLDLQGVCGRGAHGEEGDPPFPLLSSSRLFSSRGRPKKQPWWWGGCVKVPFLPGTHASVAAFFPPPPS